MAKKPYKYNVLSNVRCIICNKRLKKNVVERKPTADKCYVCSRVLRLARQGEGRDDR